MDAGVAFALVSAVIWGGYLFGLKRYFDAYPATLLYVLINGFAIVWYLPVAAVTLPPAAVDLSAFDARTLLVMAGVDLLLALAFVVLLRALALGDVSYVAPIAKIVPAFVLPIEVLALGERFTPLEIAGVFVVTVAVYVANFRRGSLLAPLRKALTNRAAQLALFSALLYAVTDVGKRVALQELALPPPAVALLVMGGVTAVMLPGAARAWFRVRRGGQSGARETDGGSPDGRPTETGLSSGAVRAALPKFAAMGALVAAGQHLNALAFASVPAGVASAIINTQAVVAVVLGGALLREKQFGARLVASVLAVSGVSLIAL
jgi:drug/metabolite transporter (DMT)-like permease